VQCLKVASQWVLANIVLIPISFKSLKDRRAAQEALQNAVKITCGSEVAKSMPLGHEFFVIWQKI